MEQHEYAFDVRLFATVRVTAKDEAAAREVMERVLDSCSPTADFLDGYNEVGAASGVRITEFSLSADDSVYPQGAELIEVDGEDAEGA